MFVSYKHQYSIIYGICGSVPVSLNLAFIEREPLNTKSLIERIDLLFCQQISFRFRLALKLN